jgi:D-3-phosphoglycerate dehydrogenase
MHETGFPASLLAIARAGAGYNNIPVERCTQDGIVVFNTPAPTRTRLRKSPFAR